MKRELKQKIKHIDNIRFNGKLKDTYKKIRRIGAEPFYNIEGYLHRKYRDGKVLFEGDVALKDIILSQYHNDDFDNYRFVNGVVELLAIEHYYKKNEFGFGYYKKMQEDSFFDWESRFKTLIESYEENGFDGKHFVQLAKDFAVMDGSHRIMLAWYYNMEFIKAKVYQTERDRPFNIDFFWERGFGKKDCELIKEKRDNLLVQANYLYTGVIWPPAFNYADNILQDITDHGDGVSIVERENIKLNREDFRGLFKGLYHTDILDEDGMEYKLGLIDNSLDDQREYNIVRFKLKCGNPRMKMNPKNYTPQSETISRIKQWARRRYKNNIKNYEYDVIMHISDNYLQSKFCEKLFSLDRNLQGLFSEIADYKYAVTRIKDSNNQHNEFPSNYYYKSNCNILIDASQKEDFVSKVFTYCKEKYNDSWMNVVQVYENDSICVKVMIRDFMVFQFEITDYLAGVDSCFVKDALQQLKIHNGMNIISDKYETIIRLLAYEKNRNKIHHLKFINDNRDVVEDEVFLRKYIIPSKWNRIKKIISNL